MKSTGLIILFTLIHLGLTETPGDKLRIGDKAPNFLLKDGYDNMYRLDEMKGNFVVLLFGTRKLRKENNKWAKSFRDYYDQQTDVRVFMIADMRNIPFFVTNDFVKKRIRKGNHPVPLLLDWDQKVNTLYGTSSNTIDIVVVNPQGVVIVRQRSRTYDQSEFEMLRTKLDTIIESSY